MPEGPEIRRAADRVAKVLVGQVAEDVHFRFERLQSMQEVLRGRVVCAVETRGKALLTRFEGGMNVYSHNQLYGRWYIRARDSFPRTGRDLRFAVHTPAHSALLYSASDIEVLEDADLVEHPFLARLGPDVLDHSTTEAEVVRRMQSKAWARRNLAGSLLDQQFLCGLGNYLRSEVLYFAGVHPTARPADLSETQRRDLASAILRVTRRSYRTGGITNEAHVAKSLKAEGWPRRHFRHAVFRRGGESCHGCGALLHEDRFGGRTLTWCAGCQTAGERA